MVKENIAMMEYADSLGFDSVWLVEHHFSEYGVLPSARMMAAVSPQTYQISGQNGFSLLFHPAFTMTTKGIDSYRKGLEEGGHDPGQVVVGEPVAATYAHYARVGEAIDSVTFEQLCQFDGVIVGDPDRCIEKIGRLQEAYGITHLLCWTRMGGLDHRKVMQSMELMVRHILPCFRA